MCDEKNENVEFSDDVINGFKALEFTLNTLEFPKIYADLYSVLPKEEIRFDIFGREKLIACEVACAAICHKINWDFLRRAIYRKTLNNKEWLNPNNLANISDEEVYQLLAQYSKKERIMEKERCDILKSIGNITLQFTKNFEGIFYDDSTGHMKEYDEIIDFFSKCKVFSSDPQQKKQHLLFQTLSDYEDFKFLNAVYRPTIDYHLIRLFLRRGIVEPETKFAIEYIFKNEVVRKENTIATLRKVCADSLDMLCWITSMDLKSINRIEWWIGRTVCVNGMPDCDLESKEAEWLTIKFDKCPYYDTCYARQVDQKFLELSEPTYKGISY